MIRHTINFSTRNPQYVRTMKIEETGKGQYTYTLINGRGEERVVWLATRGDIHNIIVIVRSTVEVESKSELTRETEKAQKMADLYGLSYGVYKRQNGSFIAFPHSEYPYLLGKGEWVAICHTTQPVTGAERLKEEVDRFLLIWG